MCKPISNFLLIVISSDTLTIKISEEVNARKQITCWNICAFAVKISAGQVEISFFDGKTTCGPPLSVYGLS